MIAVMYGTLRGVFGSRFIISTVLMGGLSVGSAEQFHLNSSDMEELPEWVNAVSTLQFPNSVYETSLVPVEGSELFVTVVFQEGKKVSVSWRDDLGDSVLESDLSEGISGQNKRIIRVSPAILTSSGILKIAVEDGAASILKVHLEWIKPTGIFIAHQTDAPALIDAGGNVISRLTLDGTMEADLWREEVLEAPLVQAPETLDGNLEVIAPLDKVPEAVALRAEFSGIPLGETVNVWVNGYEVGKVALTIPKLNDLGYIKQQGVVSYAGWRTGTLYIPTQVLQVGENTIMLEAPVPGGSVKNAALQLLSEAGTPKTPVITQEEEAAQLLDYPALIESAEDR